MPASRNTVGPSTDLKVSTRYVISSGNACGLGSSWVHVLFQSFGCSEYVLSLLYWPVQQEIWYLSSCASLPPSLARSFPSFNVWAHSWSLLFRFTVITCLSSENWACSLFWHSTDCALSAFLFLILFSFVLLNTKRQLWWFSALFFSRFLKYYHHYLAGSRKIIYWADTETHAEFHSSGAIQCALVVYWHSLYWYKEASEKVHGSKFGLYIAKIYDW